MSSLRQIEANRRNALLSTGPTTPEGRAAVARNALRHGLAAHDPVINIEDRAAYQALLQALIDEHRPSTPTQSLLVEQLAIASWRLARIRSIEAGLFEFRLYTLRKNMKREHPDLDDRGRLAFVFRYDVIQTSIPSPSRAMNPAPNAPSSRTSTSFSASRQPLPHPKCPIPGLALFSQRSPARSAQVRKTTRTTTPPLSVRPGLTQ